MGRTIFLELLRDAQLAHGLNVQPFRFQTKVREGINTRPGGLWVRRHPYMYSQVGGM